MSGPVIPPRWWEQPCIEYTGGVPVAKGTATVMKPIPYRLWLRRETYKVVGKKQGNAVTLPLAEWETVHEMAVFCMLNPSIARHLIRDPTDRKCNGFAQRIGARSYGIVNPFSRSITESKKLFEYGADVAIGEHNRVFLRNMLIQAAAREWPVIMAYGQPSKLNRAAQRQLAAMIRRIYLTGVKHGVEFYSLALTPDGHPRHPLMLGYKEFELSTWSLP